MTILILIVFFIIIAVVKDIPEQKRLQELEKKMSKKGWNIKNGIINYKRPDYLIKL